jgi:hypothetical protein
MPDGQKRKKKLLLDLLAHRSAWRFFAFCAGNPPRWWSRRQPPELTPGPAPGVPWPSFRSFGWVADVHLDEHIARVFELLVEVAKRIHDHQTFLILDTVGSQSALHQIDADGLS